MLGICSRKIARVVDLELIQLLLELGEGRPFCGEFQTRSLNEIGERGTFENVERDSGQSLDKGSMI